MHSLDIIIRKNAKAAGREAAHATNDGKAQRAVDIAHACADLIADDAPAYVRNAANEGFARGRQEG
jgi:hypothetical protein